MKKKTIKWILGIIGLIFLGAVGSGLWQIGIEPVGNWLLDVIFKITTLGLSSRSDDFYQRVAKGLHEESSLQVLVLVTLIICICIGGELGKMLAKYDVWPSKKKKKKIEGMDEKEYNEYLKKLNRNSRRYDYIKSIILIIFVSIILFHQSTIIKRNNAIAHFRRVFTIAKYVMNEEEEELILMQFSAIQNKQDYLDVLDTLTQKLKEKQQELEKEQQRLEVEHQKAKKELEDMTSSDVKDKIK